MEPERRPDGTTRGGQEPPDEVQDRPEQNAAYDAAVRGERTDAEEPDTADADAIERGRPEADGREPEQRPTTATERRRSAT
jgi:hypothetical protein